MDCQRNMTHSIRHEKRATNKNWEKNGTMYCLGCKDCTDHFKPQEVKMTNKVLKKIKLCCLSIRIFKTENKTGKQGSKKSTLKTSKKQKIVFTSYKTCICIVKTVKNIWITHFQNKLVLISKNKIKGKSKCALCLTERTFIHEIGDKYCLESELEIYCQFFTG